MMYEKGKGRMGLTQSSVERGRQGTIQGSLRWQRLETRRNLLRPVFLCAMGGGMHMTTNNKKRGLTA
jgi:hypothetical protein